MYAPLHVTTPGITAALFPPRVVASSFSLAVSLSRSRSSTTEAPTAISTSLLRLVGWKLVRASIERERVVYVCRHILVVLEVGRRFS